MLRRSHRSAELEGSEGYRRILLIAALDLLLASLSAAVGLLVIFGGSLSAATSNGDSQDLMMGGAYVTLSVAKPAGVTCSGSLFKTTHSAVDGGVEYQFVVGGNTSVIDCESDSKAAVDVRAYIDFANDKPLDYQLSCQAAEHQLLMIYTHRGIPSDQRWIRGCTRGTQTP